MIKTIIYDMQREKKKNHKYKSKKLFIKGYDYSIWSKHDKESTDKEESVDLSDMPSL